MKTGKVNLKAEGISESGKSWLLGKIISTLQKEGFEIEWNDEHGFEVTWKWQKLCEFCNEREGSSHQDYELDNPECWEKLGDKLNFVFGQEEVIVCNKCLEDPKELENQITAK